MISAELSIVQTRDGTWEVAPILSQLTHMHFTVVSDERGVTLITTAPTGITVPTNDTVAVILVVADPIIAKKATITGVMRVLTKLESSCIVWARVKTIHKRA